MKGKYAQRAESQELKNALAEIETLKVAIASLEQGRASHELSVKATTEKHFRDELKRVREAHAAQLHSLKEAHAAEVSRLQSNILRIATLIRIGYEDGRSWTPEQYEEMSVLLGSQASALFQMLGEEPLLNRTARRSKSKNLGAFMDRVAKVEHQL